MFWNERYINSAGQGWPDCSVHILLMKVRNEETKLLVKNRTSRQASLLASRQVLELVDWFPNRFAVHQLSDRDVKAKIVSSELGVFSRFKL